MALQATILAVTATLAPLQAGDPPRREPEISLAERIAGLRAALRGHHDLAILEHATALGEIGPGAAAAIPWLFDGLQHPTWRHASTHKRCPEVVPAIAKALGQIGPRALLQLPDAGRWLAWSGWDPAVPLAATAAELLELVEHPVQEARWLAAHELARRHPAAVEVVLARLSDDDPDRRVHAAAAAGAFRPAAQALIDPLARCLAAQDPRLRWHACHSLGELLPASAAALIGASGNADARVRREALLGLEHGLDARLAVSPLPELELGGHGCCYEWDYRAAGDLVSRLDHEAGLDAIAARLGDDVTENRILSLMIFAKLGKATPEGIERIRVATEDEHPGVRLWAEHALRRVQPRPWSVLEDLRNTVEAHEPPRELRTQEELASDLDAGKAYEPIDGGADWALPATGPGDPRYEAALELVRRFLPELIERAEALDPEAVRILARAQQVVERHIRTLVAVASYEFASNRAAELLSAVGPAALPQVAAGWLVGSWEFCGGSEEDVFQELGEVLPVLGPCAIPALTFGMAHADFSLRSARFLSLVDGSAAPAAPGLTRAFRVPRSAAPNPGWWTGDWESVPARVYSPGPEGWGGNPERLDWLAIVCRRMGPDLIPALLDALRDELAIVRARACRGLAALEVASDEVVAALAAALADDQAQVRFAAARALERLLPPDADLRRRSAAILATFGERP